jgi:hypothetical protein
MENRDFYHFGSDHLQANITATTADFDSNINLYEELFYGDYSSITFPLTYKIMLGSRLHDIVSTSYPCIVLINNKVKTIFEENQFTGYKTFPVIFLDKNNREIHGYHGLSITGRAGFDNFSSSEIIDKILITNQIIRKYKGQYVDEWDGSDFFCPKHTTSTCVTPRVIETLRENRIKNFRSVHSKDTVTPKIIVDKINRLREEYYKSKAAESIES